MGKGDLRDPIVIDPPGFDPRAGWQECSEYVDKCGGLSHEDGSPNSRSAFGADPGCMSCPNCGEMYWAWGRIAECLECQFRFPTDWWCAYAWGVAAGHRQAKIVVFTEDSERMLAYFKRKHASSIGHPYYRYGFEHPSDDAWLEHNRIAWKEIVGSMNKYPDGVRI